MKKINRVFTALVFLFLYIPMIVLAVASFNTGNDIAVFKGFTLGQYGELFRDSGLLSLVGNSAIIAIFSSLVATVLGTMAAVGLRNAKGRLRKTVMSLTNIPMTNPDIVTGVSLALLFAFAGTVLKRNNILGFWTLLIAHITFNLPYVILSVQPVLSKVDVHLSEAAQDLGCTPVKAFFKVVLPSIVPGIVTGCIMAFTLSIDDFVISVFTAGPSFSTLPLYIYSMTKKPINPDINALSTLMFVVVLILLIFINMGESRQEKKDRKKGVRQ